MSKNKFNVSNNTYKKSSISKRDNKTQKTAAEKKIPSFSESFDLPKELIEAVELTNEVSPK